MDDFVLFLHFLGLTLGAAGGTASGLLMQRAARLPPDQAATIRSLGPMLANVAVLGLAVLWLTGLYLVWSKWGGVENLPTAFWIKLAFVVALTVFTVIVHVTYAQIRKTRNPALGARLAKVGPASGISMLAAILFAAYAFH
jgi:hypothetical protein